MRTKAASLFLLAMLLGTLSVGCGGGGGGSSPTPTPSATVTPTPSSGTPTLSSAQNTVGGQNTTIIFHGANLFAIHYRITINGIDGTVIENSTNPDGSAVSGIVQARPSSLSPNVAYPLAVFVSNDGVNYTQAAPPPSGPITFTYLN